MDMIPIRTNKNTFNKYIKSDAFTRDAHKNSQVVTKAYEKIIKEIDAVNKKS